MEDTTSISESDDAPTDICVQVTGEFERSIVLELFTTDDDTSPMGNYKNLLFLCSLQGFRVDMTTTCDSSSYRPKYHSSRQFCSHQLQWHILCDSKSSG